MEEEKRKEIEQLRKQSGIRWSLLQSHLDKGDGDMIAKELSTLYHEIRKLAILNGYKPKNS